MIDVLDYTTILAYSANMVTYLEKGIRRKRRYHVSVTKESVIQNKKEAINERNADVLTVIPLSSTDGKIVHPRNVDLGIELFQKINDVHKTLHSNAQEELNELPKAKEAPENTRFSGAVSFL